MKLRIRTSTTIVSLALPCLIMVGFACATVASGLGSWGQVAHAQSQGGRLITVHDRGTESAFVTDKSTLREAFAGSGIVLDPHDAVEPGLDEKLVAGDYQVNIYRARPVTIIDGATRQKVITPYQSAERIVKDAGMSLNPEDTTTLARSSDASLLSDGAGLQLTIKRATPLTIDLYGVTNQIRTQASTVAGLLKEKNITLGSDGRASLPLTASITANMSLRVWREGIQTVTVDEDVPFDTEQVKDADRQVGYKAVQTAGVTGKRTVTYQVTIQDGAEVSRSEIASIQLSAPVPQIEVIGTKPATLPYTGGGTKTDWLAASNIDPSDWGYADYMVQKESGWNPNAVNKSSGACGLAQALPCSKVPGDPYNPVDSLNWMNGYAIGRYGSWERAYNFWQANHWY